MSAAAAPLDPTLAALPADEASLSPAMRQYVQFKRQNPGYVLFFRMGDFYELFWEDAKIVGRVLGLTVTSRDKSSANPVPMAGVPFHSVEGYLRRMIAAGHRVALVEQMEDPKTAKGVVKRDVTRLITPGTLTDEPMLDGKTDNYLAAITTHVTRRLGHRVGLAWVELSTGGTWAMSGDELAILEQLGRLQAAEVLLPEPREGLEHPLAARVKTAGIKTVSHRPGWQHSPHHAAEQLRKQWQVNTAAGFGFEDDDDPSLLSVGAIVSYLEETQRGAIAHLRPPRLHSPSAHLSIDPATYRSLEIERTTRANSTEGSLMVAIDRTRTAMGGRLLRQWVRFPLRERAAIESRQDAIAALVDAPRERSAVLGALDGVCDIERILSRVAVGRANPRDLLALGRCLATLPKLFEAIGPLESVAGDLLAHRDFAAQQADWLASAIRSDPPPHLREGGVIADGHDAELDRLRTMTTNAQQWLAEYQAKLISDSSINSLKVHYNKVFGYYIEVTDAHRDKIPATWTRRQTVKNAERYITPELKKFEDEALTARERSIALEQKLFEALRQRLLPDLQKYLDLAQSLARLDVLAALAELAHEARYVRPTITDDRVLHVVDGRHPVLEQQIGHGFGGATQFVANDVHFSESDTVMLITGPNMAGKSTYIRQVATIVLLAHLGSFVPAKSAVIGVTDRLFSRIGASDEIHAGQSTFMVEMTETANILNNATDRSVVVLDEIGRGTSTLDGLSLAWAITEHLATQTRSRTLFATHYHELTELAKQPIGVRNFNVAVREWEDQVIFLHRIVEGGTDRSYGVHVARLAGVPKAVLDRAKSLLGQLAVHHAGATPVIAAAPQQPTKQQQMMLFAYEPSGLTKALRDADLDELSPREAHDLIAKWKREFGK